MVPNPCRPHTEPPRSWITGARHYTRLSRVYCNAHQCSSQFPPSIFPQQQHMHAIPRHSDQFSPRAENTLVTHTNQEERESRLSRKIQGTVSCHGLPCTTCTAQHRETAEKLCLARCILGSTSFETCTMCCHGSTTFICFCASLDQ